jgi:hypothetical protein
MRGLHAASTLRPWIACAAIACEPPPSASNQPTIAPTIEAIRDEVFAESCIFTECHDQNRKAGGLVLGTTSLQDGVFHASPTSADEITVACENLVNQPIENASQHAVEPDAKRVSPGDAEQSFLLRKLENRGLVGGKANCPMPSCCRDDCPPYDPGKVAAIRLWISDGASGCPP